MSKRSVFEDVGEQRPTLERASRRREPARRGIFIWLIALAAPVAVMVLVGGATRLTDSGLSITEWAPVMGAVPPLSAAEWEAAFEAYGTTTEYREQNAWMTLEDFKPIYWWEWSHRSLGRLVGLVWLAGFLGFLIERRIPEGWTGRLLLPGALGGAQGAVGWWMVSSGLEEGVVDVASYRLAIHLGLAVLIFALLLWSAWRIRCDPVETLARRRRRLPGAMAWCGAMLALAFIQVLFGALVAGIDAGRDYPTWPMMTPDSWLPPHPFAAVPLWANVFENSALVQFNHRILAYVIVLLAIPFVRKLVLSGHARLRNWGMRVGAVVIAQAGLGVATVLNAAAPEYALAHQFLALVLIGALVRARFEAAYPSEQKITA